MGANLTGLAGTIKNKLYNLKKDLRERHINIELPNFKGYKNLPEAEQMNIIKTIDDIRLANITHKTPKIPNIPNTGNKPTKLSKNYKKYLDITGLSDSEASRQKFEDIKKLTRLSKQIQKSFGIREKNLLNRLANDGRARDRFAIEQINDWTKGRTNLQEVFANVHPYALANCLTDTLHNLEDMISPDYFIHNVLPRLHRSEDVRPAEIIREFNKLTIAQKVRFNTRVVELYYEKYQETKDTGETFDGHTALMEILREI